MGLQKTMTLDNGLVVPDAYIRIDTVSGCKTDIQVGVNYYVSQQDFQDGKGFIQQKLYNFVPDVSDAAANFIKQGYDFLKSFPDLLGAVDVLENGQSL